ncbi:ABC transporter permease [bacterium]|nr:ABC transporter permease [bacterium]
MTDTPTLNNTTRPAGTVARLGLQVLDWTLLALMLVAVAAIADVLVKSFPLVTGFFHGSAAGTQSEPSSLKSDLITLGRAAVRASIPIAICAVGLLIRRRSGLPARAGGLLLDLILLLLILAAGVALLDVLLKVVVLVVGYFQHPPQELIDRGIVEWDPNRHRSDWIGLGLTIIAAILFLGVYLVGLKVRRRALAKMLDSSFESFVSRRYLISRQGGALVNLVTIVSVLGVAVGVMALIVVISVMNGFDQTLVKRMMGVFAHVEVWPYPYAQEDDRYFNMAQYNEIEKAALSIEGVDGVAPMMSLQTFFQANTGISENKVGAMLRGLDVEKEQHVTRLTDEDTIISGTNDPGLREIVIGSELARKLQVSVGDKVYALGKVITTARGPTPKISGLKVVGVFKSGLYDVDSNFAYTSLETAQALSLHDGKISSIHIAVDDPDHSRQIAREIAQRLPPQYYVRTWQDINPEFFAALWIEKVAMFIILLLIVLVASFNIIGTLIMVVTQKTREIGILKSMGATNTMILRIFLMHGTLIGLVGTSLGTACGLWLCRFVEYDIQLIFNMPAAVYGMDRLPVVIQPGIILFLALCSLAICMVAGIIPAFRASRMNPVEALRYD